jgi:hypothetical protein
MAPMEFIVIQDNGNDLNYLACFYPNFFDYTFALHVTAVRLQKHHNICFCYT